MSQKTNAAPRLVVKIIGSKQVKQFIQEDTSTGTEAENPPAGAAHQDCEKPPDEPDVSRSQQHLHSRSDSAAWAVINQVPDRLCVTAPSGDRSRSYIHPRSRQHVTEQPETTEQRAESDCRDKSELSSAVRDELSDWQLSSLRSTEDEVAAVDASLSGTVDRSEITHLFLKNHVPLKLPTFSLLLRIFSDKGDPVQLSTTPHIQSSPVHVSNLMHLQQIHYRNLLQFIETSAFPEQLQGGSSSSSSSSELKPQSPGRSSERKQTSAQHCIVAACVTVDLVSDMRDQREVRVWMHHRT
ncbi:hypothetical protein INR49_000671 [Caranx melampygus]|nr:hypothetical protein INR49_000671 [Caranx melampygus]